jgi:hypothetical protein
MNPQGSQITNAQQFAKQLEAVNACRDCAHLNPLAADATASLEAEIAVVTAQIALLAPLLIAPTNITSVLSWINSVIGFISVTSITYTAQLADLGGKLSALQAAVTAKKAALGC